MDIITDSELVRINRLSKIKYRIFLLCGEGKTRQEIATDRGNVVSPKTVDTHFEQMKNSLEVADVCKVRSLATRYLIHQALTKQQAA